MKPILAAIFFLAGLSCLPGICQGDESADKLRGAASFSNVSARAKPAGRRVLPGCGKTPFTCVLVRIRNNSDKVVTVDGEKAKAEVVDSRPPKKGGEADQGRVAAESEKAILEDSRCGLPVVKKLMIASVAVSTLGLAGPIFSEFVSDPVHRPFLKKKSDNVFRDAQGRDKQRYELEESWLGKRLLLPGDSTRGILCFDCPKKMIPQSLTIPMSAGTSGAEQGMLVVKVGKDDSR